MFVNDDDQKADDAFDLKSMQNEYEEKGAKEKLPIGGSASFRNRYMKIASRAR